MKQGKSRFDFQLDKIEKLLNQAILQDNPAEWLLLNDLRTPAFMLEALAKMYAKWHNKKTFEKLNASFKAVEDMLGAIDYYVAFEKEFAPNAQIPPSVKFFLTRKKEEKTAALNRFLKEDKWFNGKRLKKIQEKLDEVDWLEEAEETALLKPFYLKEITKIEEFTLPTQFVFHDIEEQVHELRRKLRWLSIYPQGLQGAIKLEKTEPVPAHLVKYLTPEIVHSPYNKFPISTTQSHFLVLDESYFYALSWMIKELGKIKDEGLKLTAIEEAKHDDKSITESVTEILGSDYPSMEKLLAEAGVIVKQYFEEGNLIRIVL